MSSESPNRPPVRRGLVGAGIVALWGALFAALGAPLVGLGLAGLAAAVTAVVLLAGRRPSLPALPTLRVPDVSVPRPRVSLAPLAPLAGRARAAAGRVPPLAARGREAGRRSLAHAGPLAHRGREQAGVLAARTRPLLSSAAGSVERGARAAVAPVERRRRRGALAKEAWKLNAEGVEHRREGRSGAAVDAHERAVALFRQLADDRSEGLALNNLGLALMTEGDDVGAVDAFERALVLLGRSGDRQSEGRVLANLGTLNRRLDRKEAALVYWRQALTRLDERSPEHERMTELVELAS